MGSDPEVIVKAICASLLDSNVLVQRCSLDLLSQALPMHIEVIKFSHQDLVEVVAAATSVLLRRDMSLNRRLYNWLCGTFEQQKRSHKRTDSETSYVDDSSIYFGHYSKNLLIEAVKLIFQRSLDIDNNGPDLKSYRLVMTLLDKPEVGGVILEDIMIDVFRAMYFSKKNAEENSGQKQELIKSANLLFGTLESAFIWEFCAKAFEKASCQRFRISDTEGKIKMSIYRIPSNNIRP